MEGCQFNFVFHFRSVLGNINNADTQLPSSLPSKEATARSHISISFPDYIYDSNSMDHILRDSLLCHLVLPLSWGQI